MARTGGKDGGAGVREMNQLLCCVEKQSGGGGREGKC